MTASQILEDLKKAGSENIKKIFLKHGAKEPLYGVKVEDLKKIQKKVKENHQQIALDLFATGISDAQYLAGLMADGAKMTRTQLQGWAKAAEWQMISEFSVAWVACENEAAYELSLSWIDSKKPGIASSGWTTLSCIMATWSDERLDIPALKKIFNRIEKEIAGAPNRVRYCMNGFVIAAGTYVKDLTANALATGKKIGNVEVNMGDTSCKVPFAPDYIKKAIDKGQLGKKKKTARC